MANTSSSAKNKKKKYRHETWWAVGFFSPLEKKYYFYTPAEYRGRADIYSAKSAAEAVAEEYRLNSSTPRNNKENWLVIPVVITTEIR